MYNYDTTMYNTAAAGSLAAMLGTIWLVAMIFGIVMIVANWKIFTKAGKKGWISLIPFYNMYTTFEVAGMNGWMFLLLLIPIVNFVIIIMLYFNLAKAFGQSTGFAVGLILLNPIFLLILAFGSAKYIGTAN